MGSFSLAVPIIFGVVVLSAIPVLQRWVLKGKNSPLSFLAASYAATSMLFGAVYAWRWGLVMPELEAGFWSAVFVGTAANYGIQFFHAKAATYEQGEVSLTAPLAAMTPGLITLMAVLLGELPGWRGILGILLMAAGSWVLLTKQEPAHWWGYLVPLQRLEMVLRFRSLSPEDKERAIVVWLALGAASLATVGLLCDGLYTRRGNGLQGMTLALIVLWAILAAGYFVQHALLRNTKSEWEGQWAIFACAAFLYAGLIVWGTWYTTPYFAETFVAYVGTLKRLGILINIVMVWALWRMGVALFGEEDLKKRFIVAVIIVTGALLIFSEDLPTRLSSRIELLGF